MKGSFFGSSDWLRDHQAIQYQLLFLALEKQHIIFGMTVKTMKWQWSWFPAPQQNELCIVAVLLRVSNATRNAFCKYWHTRKVICTCDSFACISQRIEINRVFLSIGQLKKIWCYKIKFYSSVLKSYFNSFYFIFENFIYYILSIFISLFQLALWYF